MRRLSPALAALTLAGVTLAAPAARAATVTVVGPAAPALVGSAASNSPGIDLAVSCFDALPGSPGGCSTNLTDQKESSFYFSTATVSPQWTSSATPWPSSWTHRASTTKLAYVNLSRCFGPSSCVQVGTPIGTLQPKFLEADIVRDGVETDANLDIALSANNVALAVSLLDPTAITCRDLEDCVVTGYAQLKSGVVQGMAAVESAGNWTLTLTGPIPTTSANTPIPPPPFDDPGHSFTAPSCPTLDFCAAVGEMNATAPGLDEAYLASETGGRWTASYVMPKDVAKVGYWSGIDCWSASNCLAVGTYEATDGQYHADVATDLNGHWSAQRFTALDALDATSSELGAVSCSANASCWVAGEDDVAGVATPFVAQSPRPGAWSALTPLAVPTGTQSAYLSSLSCPTPSSCVAAGGYSTTLSGSTSHLWIDTQGLIATRVQGVWSTALGANATPTFAGLWRTSCSTAGYCAAMGFTQQVLVDLHSAQLPAAPSRVRWSATARVAKISWSAPAPSGSAIETYQYSLDGGRTWRSTKSTLSRITLSGLSRSRTYRVRVRAFNGLGAGAPSKVIAVRLTAS